MRRRPVGLVGAAEGQGGAPAVLGGSAMSGARKFAKEGDDFYGGLRTSRKGQKIRTFRERKDWRTNPGRQRRKNTLARSILSPGGRKLLVKEEEECATLPPAAPPGELAEGDRGGGNESDSPNPWFDDDDAAF